MQENINLKTQLTKLQTEKINTKREITNLENELLQKEKIIENMINELTDNCSIISTIDPIKERAFLFGWNGAKDAKGRTALMISFDLESFNLSRLFINHIF